MRKSVTQLKDASPLLSQKLKRPLIKISNCCWQSHLRAMLHCFEDPPHTTTTTTTTTTTRLMRSKQYYYHHQQQQRSRMYYSSCAAVSNSSSFTTSTTSTTTSTTSGTIKGNDSLENEQEKKDKSRPLLPYDVSEQQQYLNRLYGSLSIFNLTDHITLSDLEHALRHQQAEKAWQLFCTLTSLNDTTNITIFHTNINNTNNHHQYNNNNNNNSSNINNTYNNRFSHHHSNLLDENDHCIPVPYQHCIDLYGLLLYAQDLASHPNVIAMRQQQLDKIANYIEHQFGESKHDLKASVQRLKIPTYKRLQQALKWRHPKQAWKMYIKLIEEVVDGEGIDGLSKISRSHYLQLISLITMNHRYWNSKKRQHMINKITSTHANIPCQHERSLSAESIEWIGKIYSYYDHQQPKQARKVIRQFLQHVTTPAKDTIDELIWRILPFDMKTARFILDTMHQRHLPQNESVYCHLMHAYMSQHRLYNQALGVFEQMLLIGVTPTLKSFNTLLHLFADQGSTDSAVYIWDTLHGLEIEPDAATYSEMIRCFSQVGQLKSCLHYYQLMLQQQKEKANIVPTLYTYSTLIEAHGKKNDLDGVLQWFQLLLEKGFEPNEVIMTNVLKAIGYHEQQNQQSSLNIMEVIQRIVKQCTMAGIKADTTLYTLLLTLQTSTSSSTTSSSTIGTSPTSSTSSSSTSSMIKDMNNSYTDNNNNNNGKRNHQQNLSFVLQFHRDMLSKCIEPNVYTYTALIGLCGKYGFYDTAQHIFDLMKQSDHQQPNTVTYCALMENWRKANKKEKLESLLYDFILHSKSNAIHGNRLKIDTKLKHQFRCIYGC